MYKRQDLLGLDQVGDLTPGRSADLILVTPPEESTVKAVLAQSPSAEASLGAIFTLAREVSVTQVRVAGEVVFNRTPGEPSAAFVPTGSVA